MNIQAGSSRQQLIHGAALCGLALLTIPAHAQVNALKTVTGMTDTQRAVAVAIDALCPNLVSPNRTGTQAERFSASCTMLVASKLNAGNAFDLDLTDEQLRTAMDRYGGKENVGTGSTATNAPGSNALLGRFLQLHQGATGFNLADAQIDVDGRRTTLAQLAGQKGGSAGEESVTGTGWGGFANLTYGTGDKDTTARETGFDFSSWNVALGADYRFNDNLVGGAALSLAKVDSDFDLALGSTKDQVLSLSLYGTYYLKDSFYIDAHGGYSRHDFDTSRQIFVPTNNGNAGFTANATSDGVGGDQLTAFVGGGYTLTRDATTVTPYLNLAYLNLKIDQFQETETVGGMALNVQEQTVESLQSALGVRVSHSISSASGVFVPTAHVAFHHEFANSSRSITARFVNDPASTVFIIPSEEPDRNFFSLGLGVSSVFRGGLTGYVNYETVIGLRDVTSHIFGAGVRAEW